jgi:hypothetical protein
VADFVVEFVLLSAYLLVDGQQWIDDGTKMVIFAQQFDDLVTELQANSPSE